MNIPRRTNLFKSAAVLTLAAGASCGSLRAATVLNYVGTSAVSARTDGPYTIGNKFTVNTAGLSVTDLGVMDALSTGLPGSDGFVSSPISVGIWNSSGTLLSSAGLTVASTDILVNDYRYVHLTSAITLTQGQSYYIGAFVGNGKEYFLDGESASQAQVAAASSDFTLNGSFYNNGSFAAPTTNGAGSVLGRWGAANAMISAVPEPSSYAVMGAGLMGALALVRRRRKSVR